MGLRRQHAGRHGRQPSLPAHLDEISEGPGRDYAFVRHQLLVANADVDHVARLLKNIGGAKLADKEQTKGADLTRLHVPGRKVPELVDELRKLAGPDLRVAPNHVLGRASHPALLSVTPPRPASPRAPLFEEPGLPGEGTRVCVLDSGAWDHPYFGGRCDFRDPEDLDVADADKDGKLDYAAGHGTFIVGIVLQHAPRTTVVARRMPSDHAEKAPHQDYTTDLELATALADLREDLRDVDVLTLSLGGYTHGGLGLIATEAVLRDVLATNPNLVVVAGAGNDRSSEPYFPAAFKHVIGVGALDASANRRACFSNYGWWVDACAPGVGAHSTFLEWEHEAADFPEDHHDLPPECKEALDSDPEPDVNTFAGWARWDGTSFAAPRVAAAIAGRISAGRSGPEAAFDVVLAPGSRQVPLLGTVVNPRTYP